MKFALTVSGEGLVLVLPSASLYHAYLQVRSMNLKEGRYMLTNNERNDEKVGILVNSNGATPLILLNTPETVQVDENETIKCLRFRQFCNAMQYPEPTPHATHQRRAGILLGSLQGVRRLLQLQRRR